MNWKTWVPLALAIVLGGVAAKIARDMMVNNRPQNVPNVKLAKVIKAQADLPPGHEITAGDLAEGHVALDSVPANSFTDLATLIGRVPQTPIGKNQPIVESMLTPRGSGSGLQALVPRGMRAITIEVNEFSGVAGLLIPGARVDVIATINVDGRQAARTIVQNIRVTAVGQRIVIPPQDANDGSKSAQQPEIVRSVTVLANLKDAEAIELAAATGRPRLVLRSGNDHEIARSEGITLGDLRGLEKDGFWTAAAKFLAALPRPATQPAATPATLVKATTRPADEIQKRIVRVYRSGVETPVTIEIKKDNTAEASGKSMLEPIGR